MSAGVKAHADATDIAGVPFRHAHDPEIFEFRIAGPNGDARFESL
jgi:hypothetical protein